MSNAQNVVTVKITEDDLATIIAALENEAENARASAEAIGVTIAVEDKFTEIAEDRERIALNLHHAQLVKREYDKRRWTLTGYGRKGLTNTTTQEV